MNSPEGPKPRTYQPKTCAWCLAEFVPGAARQTRCDACRATSHAEAGRCTSCGSKVSGEALWGPGWTGECDRAEKLGYDLYEKLKASLKPKGDAR